MEIFEILIFFGSTFFFQCFFSTKIFSIDIFLFLFFRLKKYFFSELKKKTEHNFDVEFCELPIYDVFRAFPALLDTFWEQIPKRKKKLFFSRLG